MIKIRGGWKSTKAVIFAENQRCKIGLAGYMNHEGTAWQSVSMCATGIKEKTTKEGGWS